MDRFSKFLFLHQLIREKILYVYITKIFTLPAMLLIVLWKSKIQKILLILTQTTVDIFRLRFTTKFARAK